MQVKESPTRQETKTIKATLRDAAISANCFISTEQAEATKQHLIYIVSPKLWVERAIAKYCSRFHALFTLIQLLLLLGIIISGTAVILCMIISGAQVLIPSTSFLVFFPLCLYSMRVESFEVAEWARREITPREFDTKLPKDVVRKAHAVTRVAQELDLEKPRFFVETFVSTTVPDPFLIAYRRDQATGEEEEVYIAWWQ